MMIPSMKNVYGIAGGLLSISVMANIYTLVSGWGIMDVASRVSYSFASVGFQSLIVLMFVGLYISTPNVPIVIPQFKPKTVDNTEMLEFLSEQSKQGGKK